MLSFLSLLLGIGLLYGGGEALVRGSARLARVMGLSSLVIGLTVVAFGTSAPELASSLVAVFQDAPDVALGNILGSNIANVGLILGLSALLRPIAAQARVLFRELPFMIGVGLLLLPLALNGRFGRGDGLLMLGLFVLYLAVLLRKDEALTTDEFGTGKTSAAVSLTMVVLGIGLLVVGAKLLVDGAVGLARGVGISEQVIGLSLVAIGTSLPELAASLVATNHDEGDMVLGNVIGSNVFNVLLVLGTTVVIYPIPVVLSAFGRDLIVALVFSAAPLVFLLRKHRLTRLNGAFLLMGYAAYMVYLFR